MTWHPSTSCGYESSKIASVALPYLQGRFLDIGCGARKVWPRAIGIDNGHHQAQFGMSINPDIEGDGTDLSMFADESMDAVFSSHFLEHVPKNLVPNVLHEWARVLKVGGYLVLYVPSANLYPRMGEEGANPDHKWDIETGDLEAMLRDMTQEWKEYASGWELVESEERSGTNEYSFFIVVKKTIDGWTENLWQRNPEGKKRALVIRYGAIGDQIQTSSILPCLKEQGYHVTYNTTPAGHEVIKHDPHVDEWLIQEQDYVPNESLGPYWAQLQMDGRYDKIVNLCESIEGILLALPGRLNHAYSDYTRRKLVGHVNYLERLHDLAEVPYDFHPKFYPTEEEAAWAREIRSQIKGPCVVWAINGSSPHKVYPWTQIVTAWLLERTPSHIMLLADPNQGVDLQNTIVEKLTTFKYDVTRVHPQAGEWSIRRSLAFAQVADCVVGPETGTLNAVCMEDVAKVIYLSHSSPDNLTKHWKNTTTLTPDLERAPCYPCHRLHSNWDYCHQHEDTNAALCASGVSPKRLFEAIVGALISDIKAAAD